MFASSSRGQRVARADGTHTIRCWKCNQTISVTNNPITRAICALCQYAEETGAALPEEVLTQYRFNQAEFNDTSMLVVKEEKKIYDRMQVKFTLRSMGGDVLQALGFMKKKPAVEPIQSTRMVDQKKRTPLFGDGLNDMLGVDKKLKESE